MKAATGTLFLLPVALGEGGITARTHPADVVAIACGLRHFVVENAKSARAELKRLGHPVPLRELSIEVLPETPAAGDLERLLLPVRGGQDIGLLSEAGCPAVADPGALLVRQAHRGGIAVRPLVGPSSLLLALMASGLDGQRFAFHGYLPAREPDRSRRIGELERESGRQTQTQIFIETPYRNSALFRSLIDTCRTATQLCLATDLTLPSEKITTRTIADWKGQPPPNIDRRPTVFLLLANASPAG